MDEELPDEVACQVENLQLGQGLQPRDAPDPNSKIIFKGTAPWRIEHYPSMALYNIHIPNTKLNTHKMASGVYIGMHIQNVPRQKNF